MIILLDSENADKYRGRTNGCDGAPFVKCQQVSWATIHPLTFLHGLPWNDLALSWCQALKPTSIRVISGAEQCDSWPSRITVYIDDCGIIQDISQEVEVGLFGKFKHGHDLIVKTLEARVEAGLSLEGDSLHD